MIFSADNILTINAGSSSIKLAIFGIDQHTVNDLPCITLSINNINQPIATLSITQADRPAYKETLGGISYEAAAHKIIEHLGEILPSASITAIGHRIVHGGGKYANPTRVEDISEADWELLLKLDPQHTPAAQQLIAQFIQHYPSVLQVACFDTAFFQDLPHIATLIPIPRKYYKEGIRRYGFHGLSYASLLTTFDKKAGHVAADGRIILAHLGSGASVTATHKHKPVDTTMGFTPTSGIVMGARSGDLDPNIFSFLHQRDHMTLDEFDHMVSSQSGLLGLSQRSSDMRMLLELEQTDDNVAEAVELFVRDIKKTIGGFATILGGLDSLIFSGGIGEQSAVLRTRICQGLEFMGIRLNETANTTNDFLISSHESAVGVHVIPADEAHVIAMQVQALRTAGSET